jgi:hypothetical protein
MPHGPAAAGGSGYNAATCEVACPTYRYIGIQSGYCFCSNDFSEVTQYGASSCGTNGGSWCNYVYDCVHDPPSPPLAPPAPPDAPPPPPPPRTSSSSTHVQADPTPGPGDDCVTFSSQGTVSSWQPNTDFVCPDGYSITSGSIVSSCGNKNCEVGLTHCHFTGCDTAYNEAWDATAICCRQPGCSHAVFAYTDGRTEFNGFYGPWGTNCYMQNRCDPGYHRWGPGSPAGQPAITLSCAAGTSISADYPSYISGTCNTTTCVPGSTTCSSSSCDGAELEEEYSASAMCCAPEPPSVPPPP